MKFRSILINRLRVLLSDKLFILAVLLVPLLLSVITGYAQKKEKLGYVPLAIVDLDKTESSQILCKRLAQKEGLKAVVTNEAQALNQLQEEKAEVMVVIERGFENKLKLGKLEEVIRVVKSPATYSAELVEEMISAEALRIYSGHFAFNWVYQSFIARGADLTQLDRADFLKRTEAYWRPKPLMEVTYEEVEVTSGKADNITIPSFTAASLGLLVLFIMLALLFGSGWLCEEKANGTLQRILTIRSAVLPLFFGNTAALFLMGVFQAAVFLAVQGIFFGISLLGGCYAYMILALYILAAASLSMLLAALFETPHQLQAAAPVFALITGLMGGCLWNLIGVPQSLLRIALLTPQGWALKALTDLYAAPSDWNLALPSAFVLLGLSAILLTMAYRMVLKSAKKIL
ncbi:MAG: ABC transporter permease [Clostridia bacterium]|nr:ABC transporter permease [Clostridia bacterium]